MTEGFVGVHIGAGQHSEARTSLYLSICAKACQVAIDILKEGGSAIEAATEGEGEDNLGRRMRWIQRCGAPRALGVIWTYQ